MMEKLNEAYEELKRVDHLIYVSLKYTRTVDVILNILGRTVDAYALMVDSLILYAKEQAKVVSEPESAIERAELVKELFAEDDIVVDNMQLYLLERKLLRAKNVERENEYRRHVTMKTVVEGREEIVNIDIITNYYLYQRDFLNHVRNIIEGKSAIAPKQQEIAQAPEPPAWMNGGPDGEEEEEAEEDSTPPPPPTRQPMKVRPVNAPPRKRAPRPKKYKIQVPKGKNPILRAPYEAEQAAKAAAKKAAEKAAKGAKKAARPVAKKAPAKKATVKKKR
jgi:hypothetical protein